MISLRGFCEQHGAYDPLLEVCPKCPEDAAHPTRPGQRPSQIETQRPGDLPTARPLQPRHSARGLGGITARDVGRATSRDVVSVTARDAGGVTARDVALARLISQLAAEQGVEADPPVE